MRALATAALLTSGWMSFAAEPAVVSVHPAVPMPKPEMKNVVTGTIVLEGTLVPAGSETVGTAIAAPTMPCVPPPELKCGAPLFGGSLLASGCDICESKGRPSLLGGLFTRPLLLFGGDCGSCDTCPAPKCESAKCPADPSCGSCLGGGRWGRFKAWLCWAPCDGPRIPFFQFEPYVPANFTAMCCLPQNFGTCHDNACTGRVRGGLGLGKPGCDTGNCGTGRFGSHCNKSPQDCNAAEPKLSGSSPIDGYRFAHIEPKVYGRPGTHIDPIAGTAKATDAAKKPVIEQASAIVPAKGPKGMPLPAVRETTKPLATPFSNP
jgi:hypothetical protein